MVSNHDIRAKIFYINYTHLIITRWESDNCVHGTTRNAYDTNRIVGGSSGGEGCLLVSIQVPYFHRIQLTMVIILFLVGCWVTNGHWIRYWRFNSYASVFQWNIWS